MSSFLELRALEKNLNLILSAAYLEVETNQPIYKTIDINPLFGSFYCTNSWEGTLWKVYNLFLSFSGRDEEKNKVIPFMQNIYDSLIHYTVDVKSNIQTYQSYFADQAEGKNTIQATDQEIIEARQFLSDSLGVLHFLDVIKKNKSVSQVVGSWFYCFSTIENRWPVSRDSFHNLLKLEYILNGQIPVRSLAKLSCLSSGCIESDKVELEISEWIKGINSLEKEIQVRCFGKALAELIQAIGSEIGKGKTRFDWLIINLAFRDCKIINQSDWKHINKYFQPKQLQEKISAELKQLKPDMVNTLTSEMVNKCLKRLFDQFGEKVSAVDVGNNLASLKDPSEVYQIKDKEELDKEIKVWFKEVNRLTKELRSQIFGVGLTEFVGVIGDETELAMLPKKLGRKKAEEMSEEDFFKPKSLEDIASKGLKQLALDMVNEVITSTILGFFCKSFEAFKKKINEQVEGKSLQEIKGSNRGDFKVFNIAGSDKLVVIVANNRLKLFQRFTSPSWGFAPINVYVKDPKGCWVIAERVKPLKSHQFTSQSYRMNKEDQPVLIHLASNIGYYLDPLKSSGFIKHSIHIYSKTKEKKTISGNKYEIDVNDLSVDHKGELKLTKLYVRDDEIKGWNFSIFERLCLELAKGNDGVINTWVFKYLMRVSGLDGDPRSLYLRQKLGNGLNRKYEVKDLPEGYSSTELDEHAKKMIERVTSWLGECYGVLCDKDLKFGEDENKTKADIADRIIKYYDLSGGVGELLPDIPALVIKDLLGVKFSDNKLTMEEINYYRGQQSIMWERWKLFRSITSLQ
jgi:hypothetical protein